jgi:Arc/MetJ-type ribon-helix-helix transcriptional regulator
MTSQIALKLPDEILARIDELVGAGRFESRSHVVRAGIDVIIVHEQRRSIDEAYRNGYLANPDTPEEIAEAMRLSIASIEEEPWERWW